ncbi:MAG: bifunctional 5,10-methylenetetrahydrofolate dehydrogenase/5,10-methenyltetrahydrofolate cyclohydrolase [Phycisphaerales bacterium]
MAARIIDGKALAAEARKGLAARVVKVRAAGGDVRLDAILACDGDSPARVYAGNQARTCAQLGIGYTLHELPGGCDFSRISALVRSLNENTAVCAIMAHLPMPPGVDAYEVQRLIDPEKDVEGVNPANIGNIVYGRSSLAPCTGLAAVRMVESTGIKLRGKRCVVVGAGDVVGKPIAVLLMRREATVISCNEWTWELEELCASADVVISAAGKPGLIRGEMVKRDAVVVDVGTSRVEGEDGKTRTVGDVDFEGVSRVAGWVSPVPGGVGPMTVAALLSNVVEAAERRTGLA